MEVIRSHHQVAFILELIKACLVKVWRILGEAFCLCVTRVSLNLKLQYNKALVSNPETKFFFFSFWWNRNFSNTYVSKNFLNFSFSSSTNIAFLKWILNRINFFFFLHFPCKFFIQISFAYSFHERVRRVWNTLECYACKKYHSNKIDWKGVMLENCIFWALVKFMI